MNEGEHRLAAEVEKLIEEYEDEENKFPRAFKRELRNLIIKYE